MSGRSFSLMRSHPEVIYCSGLPMCANIYYYNLASYQVPGSKITTFSFLKTMIPTTFKYVSDPQPKPPPGSIHPPPVII